jgi:hypothetical protein
MAAAPTHRAIKCCLVAALALLACLPGGVRAAQQGGLRHRALALLAHDSKALAADTSARYLLQTTPPNNGTGLVRWGHLNWSSLRLLHAPALRRVLLSDTKGMCPPPSACQQPASNGRPCHLMRAAARALVQLTRCAAAALTHAVAPPAGRC